MKRKHRLDQLIEAKQAKIASTERTLEKLRIEVAALEQARKAAADEPAEPKRSANGQAGESQRHRSISATWKQVLGMIGAKGDASLDDIAGYCEIAGIPQKRPTLRSQMFNYVNKYGLITRTGQGTFKLTSLGAEAAGVKIDDGRKETGT